MVSGVLKIDKPAREGEQKNMRRREIDNSLEAMVVTIDFENGDGGLGFI